MGPNRFPVLRAMAATPTDQMNKVDQLSNRRDKTLRSWITINNEAGICNKTKITKLQMIGADPSGFHSLSLLFSKIKLKREKDLAFPFFIVIGGLTVSSDYYSNRTNMQFKYFYVHINRRS